MVIMVNIVFFCLFQWTCVFSECCASCCYSFRQCIRTRLASTSLPLPLKYNSLIHSLRVCVSVVITESSSYWLLRHIKLSLRSLKSKCHVFVFSFNFLYFILIEPNEFLFNRIGIFRRSSLVACGISFILGCLGTKHRIITDWLICETEIITKRDRRAEQFMTRSLEYVRSTSRHEPMGNYWWPNHFHSDTFSPHIPKRIQWFKYTSNNDYKKLNDQ